MPGPIFCGPYGNLSTVKFQEHSDYQSDYFSQKNVRDEISLFWKRQMEMINYQGLSKDCVFYGPIGPVGFWSYWPGKKVAGVTSFSAK